MKSGRHVWTLLACLTSLGPVSAWAQAPEAAPALVITVENLMAGDARHRELAAQGRDPDALLPGDLVLYRLRFTNITDVPVRNVVFQDPLPAGLRYVGGSAAADRADVLIEYSIDGGGSYAAQPMVEETVDGRAVQKPAPPELYTHIRWTVRGWVEPGAQIIAEFRAQLPPQRNG